jgi:hypothetical protein
MLLNSRTQTKNVQPQTDLVIYQLTTTSPWLHCCHNKVSSITSTLTKTSRAIENHK